MEVLFDIQPEPLAEHIILASRRTLKPPKPSMPVTAERRASCNGGCRRCQRCLGQDNGRWSACAGTRVLCAASWINCRRTMRFPTGRATS